MSNYDYPHINIRVDDESGAVLVDNTTLPLHLPFFPIFAPKGPINKPVIGSSATLSKIFSSDVLEASSALGNIHQMQYMRQAAGNQQICVMRLDDNSKALGFSLIAIAQQKTVPAYQKDSSGNFVLADSTVPVAGKDSNGYAFQLDKSGNTQPQQNTWVYSYGLVPLVEDDNGDLIPTNASIQKAFPDFKSGVDQWFEIARLSSATPGSYITRSAFALSLTTDEDDVQSRINMPMIRFYPKFFSDINFNFVSYKNGVQSFTPTDVYNLFGQPYTDFVITADSVLDPMTSEDMGWQAQINNAYTSTSGSYLDYDITFNVNGGFSSYGDVADPSEVKGILALAQLMASNSTAYTPALAAPAPTDAASKWDAYIKRLQQINVLSGQTLELPANGLVNSSNLLAAPLGTSTINGSLQASATSGGTGGKYSWLNAYDTSVISSFMDYNAKNLDSQLQNWANSDLINVFSDDQQYPITHIYDSGWSINTKIALMRLMNVRDNVRLDLASDDFSTPLKSDKGNRNSVVPVRTPLKNDAALAVGTTLMTTAQSYTDTEDSNTRVFRVELYPQSGEVNIGNNTVWLPYTYWRMLTRIRYYSGTAVAGTPKGRPNNELSMFSSTSWIPTTKDLKQTFWSHGMNCAYFATPTLLFMPDIRTVYSDTTSLLSSGTYSDYICFVKQICRNQWTYFVGKETPVEKMTTSISYAIDNACNLALSTYMPTSTTVDIEDGNTSDGTTAKINTKCYGNMPDRIWDTVLTAVRMPRTTTTN